MIAWLEIDCKASEVDTFTNVLEWLYPNVMSEKAKKREKPVICDECGVQITSKRNYRKHLLRVHGIGATKEMPRTICTECRESFEILGHARKHIATEHIIKIEMHCVFCNTLFPSYQANQTHMQQEQEHGLPAYKSKVSINIGGGISASLQQSAFDGKLKKFELVIEKGEVDTLSL